MSDTMYRNVNVISILGVDSTGRMVPTHMAPAQCVQAEFITCDWGIRNLQLAEMCESQTRIRAYGSSHYAVFSSMKV